MEHPLTGTVTRWWQGRDGVTLFVVYLDLASLPHPAGFAYQIYQQPQLFVMTSSNPRVYPNSVQHVGSNPNHLWDYCGLNNAGWAVAPPTPQVMQGLQYTHNTATMTQRNEVFYDTRGP